MPGLDDAFRTRFVEVFEGTLQTLEWLRIMLQREVNAPFRKFQQHDAFEALGFMFTMLNFAEGFAFDYIVGQKENVVCPNCGVVMERQCENDDGDGFLEIPIEKYMQANDVQALIDAYQTEQEKEVECYGCHATSDSRTKNEIYQTGQFLIMKLYWFEHGPNGANLINDKEIFPSHEITVNGKVYHLKSLVMHDMRDADSGHHTAHLFVNGQWIKRSDSSVTYNSNVPKKPYILFYEEGAAELPAMEVSSGEDDPAQEEISSIKCPDCDMSFQKKQDFMRHTIVIHQTLKRKIGDVIFAATHNEKVACPFCGKQYAFKHLLRHTHSCQNVKTDAEKKRKRKEQKIDSQNRKRAKDKDDEERSAEKKKEEADRKRRDREKAKADGEKRAEEKKADADRKRRDRDNKPTPAQEAFQEKKEFLAAQSDLDKINEEEVLKKVKYPFKTIKEGKLCPHCKSRNLPNEPPTGCCNGGKVKFDLPKPHPLIRSLLSGISQKVKNFRKNIRYYNNALTLASMGGLGDENLPKLKGYTPNVRFHGRIYHALGGLVPEEGEQRKFAQFFTYDANEDEEAQARMNSTKSAHKMDKAIITGLQKMIKEVNPYVKDFKMMSELSQDVVEDVQFVLKRDKDQIGKHEHPGQFHLPSTNEVAIIAINEALKFGDIKVFLKGGGVQFISEHNHAFDSLHFILLFPDGYPGWTKTLKKTDGKKLTAAAFYKYLLQYRDEDESIDGHFNTILRSGRLMQEYVCSMYFKIEQDRLWYIQNEYQDNIRMDSRKNIMDAIHQEDDLKDIGRNVVLPATYIGSPRWYQKRFQDAMAIVRELGKPDLFITFTAHGKWDHNIRSLHEGEDTEDRPDVTNRIFKQKLERLKKDIMDENFFGRAKALVYTIEFQKRG